MISRSAPAATAARAPATRSRAHQVGATLGQQQRLVADSRGIVPRRIDPQRPRQPPAVAAGQEMRPPAARDQLRRQRHRHRRLAGAARDEIADADHRHGGAHRACQPPAQRARPARKRRRAGSAGARAACRRAQNSGARIGGTEGAIEQRAEPRQGFLGRPSQPRPPPQGPAPPCACARARSGSSALERRDQLAPSATRRAAPACTQPRRDLGEVARCAGRAESGSRGAPARAGSGRRAAPASRRPARSRRAGRAGRARPGCRPGRSRSRHRAARPGSAARPENPGAAWSAARAVAARRIARRDHRQQVRQPAGKAAVRPRGSGRLLAGMGAGGKPDRTIADRRGQSGERVRIGGQGRRCILEVAGGRPPAWRPSAASRARSASLCARQSAKPPKSRGGARRQPRPAAVRSLRDAPVDQRERQVPRARLEDQVRPQLGFDQHARAAGASARRRRSPGLRPVDRRELMPRARRQLVGRSAPPRSPCRWSPAPAALRSPGQQRLDQRQQRAGFADARGMQPHAAAPPDGPCSAAPRRSRQRKKSSLPRSARRRSCASIRGPPSMRGAAIQLQQHQATDTPPRPRPPAPEPRTAAGTAGHSCRRAPAVPRWLPVSTIRPASTTAIRSASITVDRRCATPASCGRASSRRSACLDRTLGVGIDRRGGLVEEQDRGVLEHRAGDADALALAAREAGAARPDRRVVAGRQGLDEVVRRCRDRGAHDRLAAGVRPAVGDVGGNACRRTGRRPG